MTDHPEPGSLSQSRPQKKNPIKKLIQSFFKPGIETQLHIRNMVLTEIPNQATRVFICIRQGRTRVNTQPVKIISNTAAWQDEVLIDYRVPSYDFVSTDPQHTPDAENDFDDDNDSDDLDIEINPDTDTTSSKSDKKITKKEKKEMERKEKKEKREKEKREKKEKRLEKKAATSFCLRFLFRLENVSGRSSTPYGIVELDLVHATMTNDSEYSSLLSECNYQSRFSCLISVRVKNQSNSTEFDIQPPLRSLDDDESVVRHNETKNRSNSINKEKRLQIHESKSLDEIAGNYNLDSSTDMNRKISDPRNEIGNRNNVIKKHNITLLMKSNSSGERSHSLNKSGGELQQSVSKNAFYVPLLNQNALDEEEKLPFKVNPNHLNKLSDQVDSIISHVLQTLEEE